MTYVGHPYYANSDINERFTPVSLRASDLALITAATIRLTRVVTTDDIGDWWIRQPLTKLAGQQHEKMEHYGTTGCHADCEPAWTKYLGGLDCPHCVSFHAAYLTLGTYLLARRIGPGALAVWRFGAGALGLSAVAGHLNARID